MQFLYKMTNTSAVCINLRKKLNWQMIENNFMHLAMDKVFHWHLLYHFGNRYLLLIIKNTELDQPHFCQLEWQPNLEWIQHVEESCKPWYGHMNAPLHEPRK
jgi:hypothetical protein